MSCLFALLAVSPAFAGNIVLGPTAAFGTNVEERELQVNGNPTISLYCPRWVIRYPQPILNTAKSGGGSLIRLLKDVQADCAEGRRYWNFVDQVFTHDLIGSGGQATSQFVQFPYGLIPVVRLGLSEAHGVEAVAGSLDDGLTFMPGVAIPGKGWCIAFPPDALQPGEIHHFIGMAVDRSGRKKVRFFTFKIRTKSTSAVQWVPLQFHVQAPTKDGELIRDPDYVRNLSREQMYKYCKGLFMPTVEIEEDINVNGNGHKPEKRGVRSYPKSDKRPVKRSRQDVIVEFEENGRPSNREVDVTIVSLREGEEIDAQTFTVAGRSVADVKVGDGYAAIPESDRYELVPEGDDGVTTLNGQEVVVRQPDARGKLVFTFRPIRNGSNGNGGYIRPSDRDEANGTTKLAKIVVHATEAQLRKYPLKLRWSVDGKESPRDIVFQTPRSYTERFDAGDSVDLFINPNAAKYWWLSDVETKEVDGVDMTIYHVKLKSYYAR